MKVVDGGEYDLTSLTNIHKVFRVLQILCPSAVVRLLCITEGAREKRRGEGKRKAPKTLHHFGTVYRDDVIRYQNLS